MRANFSAAYQSLRESLARTLLASTGVAVAAIAVLLLVSIGEGVQKDIRGQVEDLGVNLLIVVPGNVSLANGFNPNLTGQSFLKEDQAERLRGLPGIVSVATLTFAGGGVRYQKRDAYPFVIACSPQWFLIRPVEMEEGLPFDLDESRDVVVLGQLAKEDLFGTKPATGKQVEINGHSYKVIGVTREEKAGQSMFAMQGFQNVAYIPYAAFKKRAPNTQIDRFFLKTVPDKDPKSLVKSVETELSKALDEQQFSVLTQEDLLGLIYKVVGILGTLVVGLTCISLFIGGVGVMTVMLMAVNERRKEIGVRKATGARSVDVFWQFLFESAMIGLLGVAAGLLVNAVVCTLLAQNTNIKPVTTLPTVGLAVMVGLGLGTVFGVVPAYRAARLDPINSLRME